MVEDTVSADNSQAYLDKVDKHYKAYLATKANRPCTTAGIQPCASTEEAAAMAAYQVNWRKQKAGNGNNRANNPAQKQGGSKGEKCYPHTKYGVNPLSCRGNGCPRQDKV